MIKIDRLITASNKKLEEVMQHWKGTPEELGVVLYEATMTIDAWLPEERWRLMKVRSKAIRTLIALPGGRDLLKLEQKLVLC
jgi:hypothetical protein